MCTNVKSTEQSERKMKKIRYEEDANCTNVISFPVSTWRFLEAEVTCPYYCHIPTDAV